MNLKRIIPCFLFVIISISTYAQEIETNIVLDKPFRADGISNEWNEPLNQYNTDTKLAFALANDDKNLYIVIESLDPATTRNVLFGGITLNISTSGKKKQGINLTFPFRDRSEMPRGDKPNGGEKPNDFGKDKAPRDMLSERGLPPIENHGMKVSGFKNIKDGILNADNGFGIESGMSLKPNQDLIYEIAIPLAQLEIGSDWKNAIAYDIKLNASRAGNNERGKGSSTGESLGGKHGGGMGRSGGGGIGGGKGMGGGRGGQRTPQGEAEHSSSKQSDFWIKYKLARA